MSARHRDQTPPYEIMSPRLGQSVRPVPRPRSPDSSRDADDPGYESSHSFWHAASKPLVLRVPRGLGAVILVAILGVMMMAYWVGHNRGESAAGKRFSQQQWSLSLPRPGLPNPLPPPLDGGAGDGGQAAKVRVGDSDPRQVGYNYLILARYPIDEARKLVGFLARYGLDAFIVPSNNTKLVHVVAARGLPGGQWNTPARSDYEKQLRQAGRRWQAHNKGRGSDLSDMHGDKYEGG